MQKDSPKVIYRYKYRPMDDGNLKIITEGTLKFTCPTDFNDPFDSSPAYDRESIKDIYKTRPDLVKRAGDARGYSPAQRIQNKGKLIADVMRAVDSGEWSRGLVANVGAFCVSRNPCHPLMWAHYADIHKGFLVEFRIGVDAPHYERDMMTPQIVVYKKERPILPWGAHVEDVEPYLLTKSDDWEYEEEERMLDIIKGPDFYPYSRKHFLHSVTAGARMSTKDYERLRSAVEIAERDTGKSIALYRARLSQTTYKVYIPGHPNPAFSSPD